MDNSLIIDLPTILKMIDHSDIMDKYQKVVIRIENNKVYVDATIIGQGADTETQHNHTIKK